MRPTFRSPLAAVLLTLPLLAAAQLPDWHGQGRRAAGPQGEIYFETEGSGPPVVLVAGGPGASHAAFHPWFSKLAARYTVVYLDNVGRGRAGALPAGVKHSPARDAADLETLRQALGVPRLAVIGHSYGGLVAAAWLAGHPVQAGCTVLSNTLHSGAGWQQSLRTEQAMAAEQAPLAWERILALRAQGVKSTDPRYSALWDEAELDSLWYDPANAARVTPTLDPVDSPSAEVYAAMLGDDPEWVVAGPLARFDPRPALRKRRVPVLVVSGRYDRIVTPRIALALQRSFPPGVAQLQVFEKSGHRPWMEESDAYFDAVGRYLDDCHAREVRP